MKRIFVVCILMIGTFGISMSQDSSGVAPEVPAIAEPIMPVDVEPAVATPATEEPVVEDKKKKEKKVKEEKPAKEKKVKEEKVKEEKPAKEPSDANKEKTMDTVVKLVGVALIGVAMWLFFSPAK